jgi:hypothetical protein
MKNEKPQNVLQIFRGVWLRCINQFDLTMSRHTYVSVTSRDKSLGCDDALLLYAHQVKMGGIFGIHLSSNFFTMKGTDDLLINSI